MTQKSLKQIFSYDPVTGFFRWRVARNNNVYVGKIAGCKNRRGYVYIGYKGKVYAAHRLAWLYVHGAWPKDQIDHINQIKNDNRFCNLREADQSLNNTNRKAWAVSGFQGITKMESGKYRARIRQITIGLFATIEEAVKARQLTNP